MSLKSDPFIPLVDLSPFTHEGAPETRVKASRDFCNACRNFGFANVIGHGVSESMLQEAFSWSKKLFDLPHEEKMKAPHPASSMPHRGYSPPGLEKVYSRDDLEEYESKGQQAPSLRKIQDFKVPEHIQSSPVLILLSLPIAQESYEIGSEHNPPQPNIWLPEEVLPGYREFTTTFYWELDKAAKIILEAIALGLNLTKDEKKEFLQLHSGHNNQLRLLHYPSIEAEKLRQQVVGRMPPHQDWSSFTFLFQDDVGGLELLDPHSPNSFIAAQPIPGACILNVGDMLQRFTNGTCYAHSRGRTGHPPCQTFKAWHSYIHDSR